MNVISKTDIGCVRTENQDKVITEKLEDNVTVAVLCDGMGGENSGSLASSLAVETVFERIKSGYRDDFDGNNIRNLLFSSVAAANAVVYENAQKNNNNIGMGTTCVAVICDGKSAYFVNVGDSRAYFISETSIIQITTDHTVVRMLLEQGSIQENELKTHPQKNYITKAIGVDTLVEPDYFEVPLGSGYRILLCSDGLTNYLEDTEIFDLSKETGADDFAEKLIAVAKERGGSDNITVAIITD